MNEGRARTILVTGFAAWSTHERNPSTDVALAMDRMSVGGATFSAHAPLPVQFENAAAIALKEAYVSGASAILALGLAAKTEHIRVETRGQNRCATTEPDAEGRVRLNEPLIKNAPEFINTRLVPQRIVDVLVAHKIDARLSDDAGGYVCNDLYYRLLHAEAIPVVFVHIPTNAHEIAALPNALAHALADVTR